MALALPFVAVWFLRDAKFRPWFWTVSKGVLFGLVPMLISSLSEGYHTMVVSTPESLKLMAFKMSIHGSDVLLVPIAMSAILLGFWSVRRYTDQIVVAFLCISFLTIYFDTSVPGLVIMVFAALCNFSPWAQFHRRSTCSRFFSVSSYMPLSRNSRCLQPSAFIL